LPLVQNDHPHILFVPRYRTFDDMWVQDSYRKMVIEALDGLLTEFNSNKETPDIDPSRLYLTGFSQGGMGTWNFIKHYPFKFAAAAPLSGFFNGPQSLAEANALKHMPIWIFNGDGDRGVEGSRVSYRWLMQAGARNVRYHEYEKQGHVIDDFAYFTPGFMDWFFSQSLKNARKVTGTKGLVAFWDFQNMRRDGAWISAHDPEVINKAFPLALRQIGDEREYTPNSWPYQDSDSKLEFDDSGPFGRAVRFNRGHIYGAVARTEFDGTPLDLHGMKPFTLISWVKITGQRHMIAGIWDEGGWDKYAGRRQVALFAGLFGQDGVIAHISATGAASYPQSDLSGARYARCRAIDGMPFDNDEWVAMATTFDPERGQLTAYLNGEMTPLELTDPVAQDVYQYDQPQPANPFHFPFPVFSPRAFILKFNGYDLNQGGICEHRLHVDLDRRIVTYQRDPASAPGSGSYRVFLTITRDGSSIFQPPIEIEGVHGREVRIPAAAAPSNGAQIEATLETMENGEWKQVGETVAREIREGAPFTFGRALGLGSEELSHGSELFIDGVAVFNRVLSANELKELSAGCQDR
jgi:hypothetical protein